MESPHWFVLTGTRNAADRVQLLALLRERDRGVKRLADVTELEYATVEEHLAVLRENDLVEAGERDGMVVYRPTPQTRQHWDAIAALLEDAPAVAPDEPAQIRSR